MVLKSCRNTSWNWTAVLTITVGMLVSNADDSLHSMAMAQEQVAKQTTKPIIWVWDFQKNPSWQRTELESPAKSARKLVQRLNREQNPQGRHYELTNGRVPDSVPDRGETSQDPSSDAKKLPTEPLLQQRPLTPANLPQPQITFPQRASQKEAVEIPDGMLKALGLSAAAVESPTVNRRISKRAPAAGDIIAIRQISPNPQTEKPQPTKATSESGRLVLPKSTTAKIGLVAQGTEVKQTFEIRNEGRETITVELIEKSCGCTQVKVDGKALVHDIPMLDLTALVPVPEGEPTPEAAPSSEHAVEISANQTATIEVIVDTHDRIGRFEQFVRLKTSDPRHSAIEFRVTGEVRPQIEVSSKFLDVLDLRNDGPIERSVEVTSALNPAMEILFAEPSHSAVKVRVERMSVDKLRAIGAKAGFVVNVSLPRGVPQGTDYEELFLRTNDTSERTLVIPLVGEVGSTYLTPAIPQLLVAE